MVRTNFYIIISLFSILLISCQKNKKIDESNDLVKIPSSSDNLLDINTSTKNKEGLLALIKPKIVDVGHLNGNPKVDLLNNESIEIINEDNRFNFIIVTNYDTKNEVFNEIWYNSNYDIIYEEKSYYSIRMKWFCDLDNDNQPEIIRAEGEEDVMNYSVSKITDNKIEKLFYFNPITIKTIEQVDKYFWIYPNGFENIKVEKNKIFTSFSNVERDDEYDFLDKQEKMPSILITGWLDEDNMVEMPNMKFEPLELSDIVLSIKK